MRGVGSLQRLLGGSVIGGAGAGVSVPRAALDEELRRLDEQEAQRAPLPPPKRARVSPPPPPAAAVVRLSSSSSPSPPPPITTTADGLIRLVTAVVGRAGRAAIGQALLEAEARGEGDEKEEGKVSSPPALALAREPNNLADRNAVLVVDRRQPDQHLGYLSRTVAGYLGPLLDSGLMRAERVVTTTPAAGGGQQQTDDDATSSSAVEVLLRRTRTYPPALPGSAAAAMESEVSASIAACLEAGRRSLVRRRKKKTPTGGDNGDEEGEDDEDDDASATGHAAAFQRILDDVRRCDAHLLSQEELRVLSAVERLRLAPRRLLLRLVMRRQAGMRWVPLGSLKQYEDVGDVVAAARALARAAVDDDGDDDGEEEQQVQQTRRPRANNNNNNGLLRFWSPQDPDPDTWASALASVSCSTLQTAGLAVMPRGHPVLRSTKDALVSSLAAVARASAGVGAVAATTATTTTKNKKSSTPPRDAPPHERLHAAVVDAAGGDLVQVQPQVVAAFRRLQRVYFLDEGLDLGVFLAAERGVVRYPPYVVRRSPGARLPFASRRALLEYERALADAAALEAALAVDDARGAWRALQPALEAVQSKGAHKAVVWAELPCAHVPNPPAPAGGRASSSSGGGCGGGGGGGANPNNSSPCSPDPTSSPPPPLFLARFSAAWVYTSMATVAVSLLERERRHREAVDLLQCLLGGNACPARRGEWWSRLCTNLEHHLKQPETALEMAEASLADAWVRQGDRLGLQRRVARLCKPPRRWKRPPWAHEVLSDPPERRLVAKAVAVDERGSSTNGGALGVKIRYRSLLATSDDGGDDEDDEDDEDDPSAPPLVTVEELALQHYSLPEQGGWKGVHAEGGIWRAFFVLFLWDVIFCDLQPPPPPLPTTTTTTRAPPATTTTTTTGEGKAATTTTARVPVPPAPAPSDVFRSPFQTAPLDLDTDAFFPSRHALIERRLAELSLGGEDALERCVRARWAAHAGCACRGMAWGARWTSVDELVEIARCVGAFRMSVVLRLMAEDHAGSGGGGMPDLLLWSPPGAGGGTNAAEATNANVAPARAMLVEVKSRNDRLSDQQRMWIAALANSGWDVHVLKVTDE